MPSSVVFAALVLAWLVVLVPVVARRRQMVPRPAEADLSARVLPRTAAAPLIEEVPVTTTQADGRTGGERTTAAGPTGSSTHGTAAATTGAVAATALAERADETPEAVDAELDLDRDEFEEFDDLDGYDDLDDLDDRAGDRRDPDDAPRAGRERVLPRRSPEAGDERDDDGYDDRPGDRYDDRHDDGYEDRYEDRYAAEHDAYEDDAYEDDAYEDDLDEEPVDRAPRVYRPGRGGFDPDAAAAAARARYTYRQRIALGLISVAVLSALAAMVVSSALWWVHGAADVVLVGYLVFLRRQTRIEEEVRARRAARLSGERRALEARRARQAEHDARMSALRDQDWIDAEYDEDDRDADDDRYADEIGDEAPRWAAPRTPAPPVPEDLELVDDTDDDPAFHDLDGERTYGYRRAAGA
ncbi:gephyrin-like molybdotransferase receptor GlpR [Actinomycetospora cinnamomea]|uniref:Uncharacterized protein n=1 Tax=Actinomycetospora cinnamomea TaxID=663609 RepID=A0A2U1FS18_9PSEU|nr:gephyrin-like molybdotransferase receptor GlpR [Actinomycetospora cinnamomea]PVZ14967.1 hypothetical protein C8D89_101836 [Actinomycetospora cinnamomea]